MSPSICFSHSYVAPLTMTSSFALWLRLLGDYTTYSCASPRESNMFVCVACKRCAFVLRRPKKIAIRLCHSVYCAFLLRRPEKIAIRLSHSICFAIRLSHSVCFCHSCVTQLVMTSSFANIVGYTMFVCLTWINIPS